MVRLKTAHIKGFRSIADQTIEFRPLTVLIGANGSGKTNLLSFFSMLDALAHGNLREWVAHEGQASSLLYCGPKRTKEVEAELVMEADRGDNRYRIRLGHAAGDQFVFLEESVAFTPDGAPDRGPKSLGVGHQESQLTLAADGGDTTARFIRGTIQRWKRSHFHDTSDESPLRQGAYEDLADYLHGHGGNLAPWLLRRREDQSDVYRRILTAVQQVAPFLYDFELEPVGRRVNLTWRQVGMDEPLSAHELSDGTLRAIALICLLLQPRDMLPNMILVDEPELGLHPFAINVIAGLFRAAAEHTQVVIATQSTAFLDQFEPEDVVVADRVGDASEFGRLSADDLGAWLEDYTLGELWEKNVLGGRPA